MKRQTLTRDLKRSLKPVDESGRRERWTMAMFPVTVQLSAGRLISRHLGHSLYTWTAVIGVMLAGMALGNGLGGRLADRARPERALLALLPLCSAAVLTLLPMNAWMGALTLLGGVSWPGRILAHVGMVFFVPSVLMGMIDPVATRWAVARARRRTAVFGSLYAWGVAGNLVGALLTGFVLVAQKSAWRRRNGGMILTDEFAPVENLLAPVVRASRIGKEDILFKTAVRLHERRRYAESLAACRATLAIGADHYAARDLLALNLALLGRVAEAAAEWEDAIALWPNIPSLHNNLGYAYFQLGDLSTAIEQWEETVRLDPDNTSALLNLEVAREGQRLLIPK